MHTSKCQRPWTPANHFSPDSHNFKCLDCKKLQLISLTILLPASVKRGLFMLADKHSDDFTRWAIYSASVWTIFSGLFKSTHCSLMQLTGGAEQGRCCHSVALQHSAIAFIDFVLDGIIWSLYRSQMKWSWVLLAQLSVQGPFSNTVNCIWKQSMILSRWQYHSFDVT